MRKIERLDKVISNILCISRTDSRRLIKIGKVFVNGTRAKAFDTKVGENDEIVACDKTLSYCQKIYILMNKQKGVVCDDKSDSPYAVDVLSDEIKRKDLFCVGRLDKDTTGLLLITNDGEYSHSVISPKKHIEKCYRATLSEKISDSDIESVEKGLVLKDGEKLLPAKIKVVDEAENIVDFFVSEGKYHQIKRMAGALNNKVESLHRYKIGNLVLPENLKEGEAVVITKQQADKVFEN